MTITINKEQGLFGIKSNDGYSCLGFDVAQRRINAVSAWLAENGSSLRHASYEHGTLEQYAAYQAAMSQGADFAAKTGKRCNADLVPAFIGREGERVECTMYGERVRFYIGKSTGWYPSHLEIKRRNSSGGGSVCASSVSNVRFLGEHR